MKYLLVIIALLAGCATQWPLLPDSRETALQQEAERLAEQVKTRKITKTQAAGRLNIKRMELVGANPLDDEAFAFYRNIAEQRDQEKLTREEAQSRMKKKLGEMRARYRQVKADGKASPLPVFTNFLMKLHGQPPL